MPRPGTPLSICRQLCSGYPNGPHEHNPQIEAWDRLVESIESEPPPLPEYRNGKYADQAEAEATDA